MSLSKQRVADARPQPTRSSHAAGRPTNGRAGKKKARANGSGNESRNDARVIDGQKLLRARLDKGWSRQELAEQCLALFRQDNQKYRSVTPQTILRKERGMGTALPDVVRTLETALGVPARWLLRTPTSQGLATPIDARIEHEADELAGVFRIAVHAAMQRTRLAFFRPNRAARPRTLKTKVTSGRPEDDESDALDLEAYAAVIAVLDLAARNALSPLSQGFILIEEEHGYVDTWAKQDLPRWIVVIDPVDDTRKAKRGLGGTCLISAYHLDVGWCVAVVGDLWRGIMFSRSVNRPSHAMWLEMATSPPVGLDAPATVLTDPKGWPKVLRSSGRTGLQGKPRAAINLYLGKMARLAQTAQKAAPLLAATDATTELLGEGGSRGPLLVAEGLVDAAVEVCKGFRPLDFIPGAFIAAGVPGIACVNRDGHALSFGKDEKLESVIEQALEGNWRPDALEPLRSKFVIAATDLLAKEIASALGPDDASVTSSATPARQR